MRIVRLGLALAAMASAPLHSALKVRSDGEAAAWILTRYSSFERIAFVGYSDQEYKDPTVVDRAFADAVSHCKDDPELPCLVIAGATPEGIGRVYELARNAGIEAIGIVSSRALENGPQEFAVSGDHLFVIDDDELGGKGSWTSDELGGKGSWTSMVIVGVSTHMVGVGGGPISAFEMVEFGQLHFDQFSTVFSTPKFWPAQPANSDQDGVCHKRVMENKKFFDLMMTQ